MPDGWLKNPGRLPPIIKGKRVAVKLFNGMVSGEAPIASGTPAGWDTEGKVPANFTISKPPHPFEIEFYRVL